MLASGLAEGRCGGVDCTGEPLALAFGLFLAGLLKKRRMVEKFGGWACPNSRSTAGTKGGTKALCVVYRDRFPASNT